MIRRFRRAFLGSRGIRAVRHAYALLPLSPRSRARLNGFILTLGAPLLRDTVSYRAWRESREGRSPAAVPRAAGANPYEEAYRAYRDGASPDDSSDYVALGAPGAPRRPGVRLIAYYLPQFHPDAVNDAAWGRGFTEWTNVSKAAPQFLGHYQPRLPGELGFYDLRVPEVLRRQVELAAAHGLDAFCFHFYWFGGKRVLQGPLEQFHADKSLDFGYCICWANESWTRAWSGRSQDVLLAQVHSPKDDLAFLEGIRRFLEDPRYLRVDGKPLLVVYRPSHLPDPAATAARWRDAARRMGLPGLFLVAAQTFGFSDPTGAGFDAAVEFPPHNSPAREITDEVALLNKGFGGHVYDYRDLVERRVASYQGHAFPVFRGVCPGWDNEPRRPGQGRVFFGSDPATYGRWLTSACADAAQQVDPDKRLVFVNAWNEWGEGAHLEPDRRYGYAFLTETQRVASRFTADTRGPSLAVVTHLYYEDLWAEMRTRLHNIPEPFDLYVTVPPSLDSERRRELLRDFPKITLVECANRGRDILPFVRVLERVGLSRYRLVCKLHSKRSPHRSDGSRWRDEAFHSLLGSPGTVERILGMFDEHPRIAAIGPAGMVLQSTYYWGVHANAQSNRRHVRALAARLGIDAPDDFYFVAGSMFWCRPAALAGLLALGLSDADFERETGQLDGTMAHAMERFLGLLIHTGGSCLADTAGARFDRPTVADRPSDPSSMRDAFAHPTFDGERL
jgi:lipopolysaccharide biosynthesis protein